jgi:hypothetical protein
MGDHLKTYGNVLPRIIERVEVGIQTLLDDIYIRGWILLEQRENTFDFSIKMDDT